MRFFTASALSLAICAAGYAQQGDANNAAAPAEENAKQTQSETGANQPAEATGKPTTDANAGTAEATADAAPKPDASLDTLAKRAGYAFGLSIGKNLREQKIDVDLNTLIKGLRDGMDASAKPLMDEQAVQMTMMEMEQQFQNQQMERAREASTKNQTEGQAFLEKNKSAEGVKTTDSGLQYKVLKEGEGASPKASDLVTVHYVGTLLDGSEFDSSYKRNQPATFPVNGVIPGWTEALQLMKPGAKYRLFIPANLAYGEQGAGNVIGPNAVLQFDVELLSVQAGPQGGGLPPGHSANDGHNH